MIEDKLTEEELKKPYAKYLNKPMAKPKKEVLDFLEKREVLDCKKAMLPENHNMGDILRNGYTEAEYGVCTMENGGGYVAMLHKLPGVTFDMYQFWNAWKFSGEDLNLRYKIWYPSAHYKSGYRWICEDVGNGPEDIIFLQPVTLQGLGMDEKEGLSSTLLLADGCSMISKAKKAGTYEAPVPGTVCHFVRNLEDGSGIELRSRFWMGYQVGSEGLFFAMGPDNEPITLEAMYRLAEHNAYEMANLADFLPSLYEEEKETVKNLVRGK